MRLMVAVLDLGPSAIVSHRAAAALHRFDGYAPGPVEVTLDRSGRSATRDWTVHTTKVLTRGDRARVGSFPCTSATRTIIDLARTEQPRALELAVGSALREGLTSPSFLRRRLTELRGPGRYGVRMLDELLGAGIAHSPLERAFLDLVRGARLPTPTCQRIFRKDGRTIARVDFSFNAWRVLVEVSGRRGHSSDAERAKDARRRNELQAMGFLVLEFTFDDVTKRPDYVLETLRRHLTPRLGHEI
jgi:very-short-patch-repair endonuclease